MRKKKLMIAFLTLLSVYVFADYELTRGPDVGEIYFIGPTTTGKAIYHSTDFGETVTCMDSVGSVESISADLTSGALYKIQMPDALFYSDNYGLEDSWQYRTSEGSYIINSGRIEGEIFKGPWMSSENYGIGFDNHPCQTTYDINNFELDVETNIGYAKAGIWGVSDSLWLLVTYDDFETFEVQHSYNIDEFPIEDLSRGTESGELYNSTNWPRKIFHSTDYGLTWTQTNQMGGGLDYKDLVGGRQAGEVYILATYSALMHEIDHSYIFHSTDYGRTFEVFHTFAKGEEPLVANFSCPELQSTAPFTVQFSNYSVGDIVSYVWDFDNDGIADSFEIEPEYTYQDTGHYSVKLTIHSSDDSDDLIREDYIHVTEESGIEDYELENVSYELSNYPNPFILSGAERSSGTTISFNLPEEMKNPKIEIYNLKGQKVKTLPVTLSSAMQSIEGRQTETFWNGKDKNDKLVSSGIYFYKLNIGNKADLPIKKMLI
ncbi:MAG: PKD domain-containing protein, partial [Candidatus Cloacimonadales bacterium]